MRPELEAKINRLIMQRLNPEPEPMELDEFANYRICHKDHKTITIRHHGCNKHHVEDIKLEPPFSETNLKWLMLRATVHHQEVHQNETRSTS